MLDILLGLNISPDLCFSEQSVDGTEDVWFINYYSPHCGHCHDLSPVVSNKLLLSSMWPLS